MTQSIFSIYSLGIAILYLGISFFTAAFFFSGRRGYSIVSEGLILIALPLHLAYLVALGISENKVPLTSFFEALSVIALFISLVSSIFYMAVQVKSVAVFAYPLIFVFQLVASLGPRVVYLDEELFRSPLFGSHTVATLLGYAAFAYSMILGLMYLHLFRELKKKRLRRMFDRLPPLELLERMNDIALISGFVFLTIGIVLGGVLAVRFWGRIPVADPKILLSALLWLLYVIGIILRRGFNWSGRKQSYFSVIGFAVVIVFMVSVRLILPTLHRF
jgi:ABC-type transport system involved in cytochrome c biogenesis permease subunit